MVNAYIHIHVTVCQCVHERTSCPFVYRASRLHQNHYNRQPTQLLLYPLTKKGERKRQRQRQRERERERERGDNDKHIIKSRETVCMHHHSHLTQYHITHTTVHTHTHTVHVHNTIIISMSTFIE